MGEQASFTIEQLYKSMSQGKMVGGRCRKCGEIHFPPRPICRECLANDLELVEIQPRGKLLTYTIIHIAPTQFQELAPYAVGIVELEQNVKIPGIIKDVDVSKLKIGMDLTLAFESCSSTQRWPRWPRYHFKPV